MTARASTSALAALLLAAGVAVAGAVPLHAQDAAQATPIQAGRTVTGEITDSDRRLSDGSRFDDYVYRGRRGERIIISMSSGAFDTFLMLAFGSERLATDDDGGDGTDSRIEHVLPADGEYLIRANAYGANGRGRYTLLVQSSGAPGGGTGAAAARIIDGQTITGALAEGDAKLSDNTWIDSYRFSGRSGERVVITMRSAAFDAFLHLGRMNGGSWEGLETDDDSGGGTDARIEFTLPADGEYVIRANSLTPATGAYTLELRKPRGAAPSRDGPASTLAICVVQDGALATVQARYEPATGDTTVNGRPFRDAHPVGSAYGVSAQWYINNDRIVLDGQGFVKFGLPRVLGITEVARATEFRGVTVFAEAGAKAPHGIVYVPVRPGCEFQPYQREITP